MVWVLKMNGMHAQVRETNSFIIQLIYRIWQGSLCLTADPCMRHHKTPIDAQHKILYACTGSRNQPDGRGDDVVGQCSRGWKDSTTFPLLFPVTSSPYTCTTTVRPYTQSSGGCGYVPGCDVIKGTCKLSASVHCLILPCSSPTALRVEANAIVLHKSAESMFLNVTSFQ